MGWSTCRIICLQWGPICCRTNFGVQIICFLLLESIPSCWYFGLDGCGIWVIGDSTSSDTACHYDLGCRIIFTWSMIFEPIWSFPFLISVAWAPCPLRLSKPFVISCVFSRIRTTNIIKRWKAPFYWPYKLLLWISKNLFPTSFSLTYILQILCS